MTWRAPACVAATLALTIFPACSEDPPAPAVDRVGFPKDYQNAFRRLRSSEKADAKTVVIVYGNVAAARHDGNYPYGSVIVMETSSTLQDGAKKVLLDEAGHFRKHQVTGLHVMRKERGFGEAYRENRTGEWEYAEYRPDGSYITPPAASAKCASCHLKAGAAKDFVFGGQKS
jgi:Cytochrome P460